MKVITKDPEIMGGIPCFSGTRVPVKNLFDALESGESVDEFLEGFPGVERWQINAVLEQSCERLLEGVKV
jgi:uncharacterized protein (DUF433 family)